MGRPVALSASDMAEYLSSTRRKRHKRGYVRFRERFRYKPIERDLRGTTLTHIVAIVVLYDSNDENEAERSS